MQGNESGLLVRIHKNQGMSRSGKPYTSYSMLVEAEDGSRVWRGTGFAPPPMPEGVYITYDVAGEHADARNIQAVPATTGNVEEGDEE